MGDTLTLPTAYFDGSMLFDLACRCVDAGDAAGLANVLVQPDTATWSNTLWDQLIPRAIGTGDTALWKVVKPTAVRFVIDMSGKFMLPAARCGVWEMWEALTALLPENGIAVLFTEQIAQEAVRSGNVAIWQDLVKRVDYRVYMHWTWSNLAAEAPRCGNTAMWRAVMATMPSHAHITWRHSAFAAAQYGDVAMWESVIDRIPLSALTKEDWRLLTFVATQCKDGGMPQAVEATRLTTVEAA